VSLPTSLSQLRNLSQRLHISHFLCWLELSGALYSPVMALSQPGFASGPGAGVTLLFRPVEEEGQLS
jgi:hypothetical protein